jgi:hypothetical protein
MRCRPGAKWNHGAIRDLIQGEVGFELSAVNDVRFQRDYSTREADEPSGTDGVPTDECTYIQDNVTLVRRDPIDRLIAIFVQHRLHGSLVFCAEPGPELTAPQHLTEQ